MSKISSVTAHEILDSSGNPAVEAIVTLDDRIVTRASSPSGISIGKYEAREIRDNDVNHYQGLGVLTTIQNINQVIAPSLQGLDANNQQAIDRKLLELDGTPDKTHLGTNALLPVSMATAKAGALSVGVPLYTYIKGLIESGQNGIKLPVICATMIDGGKHAANTLDFQEFLTIPGSFKSYSESLELSVLIYKQLKKVLERSYLPTLTGDTGGYAPSLAMNQDALSLISQAVDGAHFRLGYDVFLSIDAASDSFYSENQYRIKDRSMIMKGSDLSSYYQEIISKYHLMFIEDPFASDDWDAYSQEFPKLSESTIVAGDDLLATNPLRLQTAIQKKAVSGIVIKLNQIGTVMESLAVVAIARLAGLKIIVSHRGSETNDDFIADFAVAVSADYMKFGAPIRGENVVKYNRLLQIEREIKKA